MPSQVSDNGSPPAAELSYECYARLLTLLLPRMRNLAVHDGYANLIWSTPDWAVDNDGDFVRETISAALRADVDIPALGRAIDNDRALYAFALTAGNHEILAVVSLEVAIPGNQKGPRPVDALRPFVQPAIECLKRELVLRNAMSARDPQRTSRAQVVPLPVGPVNDLDALDAVLRHAFDYIGCALAALWIPERDFSLSLTPSGNRMSPQLLRGPLQQLNASLQQHPRTIVVNHAALPAGAGAAAGGGAASAAYKILACPVNFQDGRLAGVLGLFNPPSVMDFQPSQARSAELLAKCIGVLVNRGRPAIAAGDEPAQVRHTG